MTDEELDAPDEVYDTMMEVQRNPTGAWQAIHDQADTITTLRAQLAEARANEAALAEIRKTLAAPDDWHPVDAVKALKRSHDRAEAEARSLKAAIFGSENYALDLKCGNFVEMAQTLHAAQKGGLDRADRAEAALAAQIEADAGLCGQNEMAIPMDHTKRTLGGLYCADVWCGEGKHAGHGYADLIRNQPHDRTALDRYREKVLREAADAATASFNGFPNRCTDAILALIEKPNAS